KNMIQCAEDLSFNLEKVIWLGGAIANDLILNAQGRLYDDGLSDLLDYLMEPPPNEDPSIECLKPTAEAIFSNVEESAWEEHLSYERHWGFALQVSVAHRTWHNEKSASIHAGSRLLGWVYAETFDEALRLAAAWS